ncbi:MAG: hypothetical protein RLZZ387_3445 [Chloroflexota bacterium]|jgi:transcriptional regulator with XRE-family HTH domain
MVALRHSTSESRQGEPVEGAMYDAGQRTLDSAIGEAIRAARVAQGLTQGELATLLGVNRSTVVKHERGQRSVSLEGLLQIARALRVPLAALVPGATPTGSAEVRRAVQLLERRPDLAPAALAALDAALEQERRGASPG